MHIEIINQIQAKINDKLSQGLSQARLAGQLGVTAPTVYNIINSKLELISDRMWNKLAAKLGINSTSWRMANTANSNTVKSICGDAQRNALFIAIAGFSGAGKTAALKLYTDKNPQSYYVLCNLLMGKKHFLRSIQQAIGIDVEGSLISQLDAIIEQLRGQDEPLLILDDGGKLNDANMKLIQLIYDELEGSCGIVLAGTEDMKHYIDKMAAKGKIGFPELKRRICYWQRMYEPSHQAVNEILSLNDAKIADQATLNYIMKHCAKNYGSLRNSIINAKKVANGDPITVELLGGMHIGDVNFQN